MRATIEWVEPKRLGIVRTGPRCYRFGSPYEYSAVFMRPKYGPNKATVKALVADGGLKSAHKRATIALLSKYFISIRWDRSKPWGWRKIN